MRTEIETLCVVVAKHYQVSAQDIRDKRRSEKMTYIRNMFVHIAREYLGLTYSEIGRYMDRDHSSVTYLHNAFRPDEIIAEKIDQDYRETREIDAVDDKTAEPSEPFDVVTAEGYGPEVIFAATAWAIDGDILKMSSPGERAFLKLTPGQLVIIRKRQVCSET